MHHVVRFVRHTVTGEYRAVCTCGWSLSETRLEDVQSAAAVHDLRQLPEIAEVVPYKSGLPD